MNAVFLFQHMTNLRTARLLMTLTLLLLAIFQVYWLKKLYSEEYNNIKRTSTVIFKEALYKLQVDRFKKDTIFGKLPGENLFTIDMVNILKDQMADTIVSHGSNKKKIIISVNSRVDSFVAGGIPPPPPHAVMSNLLIRNDTSLHKFFHSLHDSTMLYDSLPVRVVDSAYHKSLRDAKLDLTYSIVRVDLINTKDNCTNAFCTPVLPMGLLGLYGYKASFDYPWIKLFKSISIQLLLSVVMLGLTLVSFIFIYRSLVQQRRLSDIKNEFISNITHELKTPLSTVTVAIEAIKNFNAVHNPERTSEYLDIAENELHRLSLLVDKVLKLSMFEQNQADFKFEKTRVLDILNEVLTSMKLQFEKFSASVSVHNQDEEYTIMSDHAHIAGVLFNLLDNALKYSQPSPKIDIALTKEAKNIILTITDNGKGIPSGLTEKIFDKFFRVPHGDAHDTHGYGLGLSYVKEVIGQHQGSINVKSEPGKGSTFVIKIPAYHE